MEQGFIDYLNQLADGARIGAEWFGDGGQPVQLSLAMHRAEVCMLCVENRAPGWWDKHFKDPIAQTIREHLAAKNQVGLSVPQEDRLHMCRACGCCLKLKVHVPIKHIKAHFKPENHHKYPAFCWIINEMK